MLPSVWHVLFEDKCFVKDFIWRLCGWNCFPPLFPNLHSPVSMCLKPFVRRGRVQKSTPGWPPFGSVVAAFVGSRVKDAVRCEISWAPPLPNRWETGQIMALGEETIMLWLCESSICKEAILLLFFLDFSKINSCLHQHEIWLKSSGFLWPLTFCPVAAKGTNQRTPGRGVLVSLGRLRQKTEKRPVSPWHRKANRRKCRKH